MEERHQAALVQRVRARHTHSHGGPHTHTHAPVLPANSLCVLLRRDALLVATAPDELAIPVGSRHQVSQEAAQRFVGVACAAERLAEPEYVVYAEPRPPPPLHRPPNEQTQ